MKKKDFVTLVLSTVGGILFALGMCMGLIPEWDAMLQGVVIGVIGVAVLLIMVLVRRRMDGKPVIVFNAKTVGTALLGTAGAIVFGVGMCMTWSGGGYGFRHCRRDCRHRAAALSDSADQRTGVKDG